MKRDEKQQLLPTIEEQRKEDDGFEDIIDENLTSSEHGIKQPQATENVDPETYKAKVKALSEWNNITNMDQFLELCYDYYIYRGRSALILHDISTLAKLGFMLILQVSWPTLWIGPLLTSQLQHRIIQSYGKLLVSLISLDKYQFSELSA